jgi:hypothetical protein
MAVCCQPLTLGALSSRSALSLMVGALFKKFGLFLNTPLISNPFVTSAPEEGCYSAPCFGRFISTEDPEVGCTSKKFWTARKISSPPGLGI